MTVSVNVPVFAIECKYCVGKIVWFPPRHTTERMICLFAAVARCTPSKASKESGFGSCGSCRCAVPGNAGIEAWLQNTLAASRLLCTRGGALGGVSGPCRRPFCTAVATLPEAMGRGYVAVAPASVSSAYARCARTPGSGSFSEKAPVRSTALDGRGGQPTGPARTVKCIRPNWNVIGLMYPA